MAADQCDFPCSWPVAEIRSRFPALKRQIGGLPVCYFDGPAGSQVSQSVADAVADYLIRCNSNRGSANATAIESDHLIDAAHQAVADFLNAPDPTTVCFGANMTTITLSVSRALSRTWSAIANLRFFEGGTPPPEQRAARHLVCRPAAPQWLRQRAFVGST